MAEVKLSKNELRTQQDKLTQLLRYLPTLQLKKAMLQSEVNEVRGEIQQLGKEFDKKRLQVSSFGSLFNEFNGFDLKEAAKVRKIEKSYENIAGVDIPIFVEVDFFDFHYHLFSTPAWLDTAIKELRNLATAKAKLLVVVEKKNALEKELREVSIRVNLFEKKLIPDATRIIRRIKVFLGDQQLAAVGQAKVAKTKILAAKLKKKRAPHAY